MTIGILALGLGLAVSALVIVASRLQAKRRAQLIAELRAGRERIHQAVRRPGIAMFAVDRQGVIGWFEGAPIVEAGLDRANIVGREAWDVLTPFKEWRSDVQHALRGDRTERVVQATGRQLFVQCTPLLRDDGSVEEAVVYVQDRTSEHEASARAERLAEVRSRTLAVMNHRIREQLTSLFGAAELLHESLADRTLTPMEQGWLDLEQRAAERLLGYVEHMVGFLEADAGGLELTEAPFSLRDAVAAAVAREAPRAARDETALVARYPHDAPDTFSGDGECVRELLELLVSVAVGTNAGGQVIVNVEVPQRTTESAVVEISVEDGGRGVDAAVIDRMFHGFESESAMWAVRSGGSGLELPLAQRIAHALGGELRVDSAADAGTTFAVRFELARSAGAASSSPETITGVALPRQRVLLIEDAQSSRDIVKRLLQGLGHEVTATGTGAEALRAAEAAAFDVVLTELHMPVADGFDVQRILRERLGAATPPVVAFTADSSRQARRDAAEAGMAGFLAKPATREALDRTLRSVLATVDAQAVEAVDTRLDADLDPESAAVLQVLARTFAAVAPSQLLALQDAALNDDHEPSAELLASLDRSAELLGATRMRTTVERLADALAAQGRDGIRKALAQLAVEVQALIDTISTHEAIRGHETAALAAVSLDETIAQVA